MKRRIAIIGASVDIGILGNAIAKVHKLSDVEFLVLKPETFEDNFERNKSLKNLAQLEVFENRPIEIMRNHRVIEDYDSTLLIKQYDEKNKRIRPNTAPTVYHQKFRDSKRRRY